MRMNIYLCLQRLFDNGVSKLVFQTNEQTYNQYHSPDVTSTDVILQCHCPYARITVYKNDFS